MFFMNSTVDSRSNTHDCVPLKPNIQSVSESIKPSEDIKFFEYFSVFTVSLLCLSTGNAMGWVSLVMVKLKYGSDEIKIDHTNINILPTVMISSGLVAPAIIAFGLNRFGRKLCLQFACLLFIVGHILLLTMTSFYVLLIVNTLFGFGNSISLIISSIYLAEISSPRIRGKCMTLITVQKNLGLLMEYIIGPNISIRTNSLITLTVPIIALTLLWKVPETAHYFLYRQKPKKALESLKKLRTSENDALKEIDSIRTATEKEKELIDKKQDGKSPFKRLISVKANRHALYLCLFLVFAREMSGVLFISVFCQILVTDVKYLITPWFAGVILGIMNFVGACVSATVVDHFGRRKLLTLSTILCSIPLGALAIYQFCLKTGSITSAKLTILPVIFLLIFKFTSTIGADSIPAIIAGESFPIGVKGVAILVINLFHVCVQMLMLNIFHYVWHYLGLYVTFGFLSGFCVLLAGLQFIFVKETKCKTLEAVQESFE